MTWISRVPRHFNRSLLASIIIHYSTEIAANTAFTIGPFVASVAILVSLLPFALLLISGLKIINLLKRMVIRRRHPCDVVVNNYRSPTESSYLFHDSNYATFLTTLRAIVNENDIIRRLHHQLVEKKIKSSHVDGSFSGQSQLKCILSSRYGLPVWTTDENFDIKNHIITIEDRYNGRPITMKNIQITIRDLCRRLPNICHPPWEIFILHIYGSSFKNPDSTALLIRTHSFLSKNSILTNLLSFDQQHSSSSFPLFKVPTNPTETYIRPIFIEDSAARELVSKMVNTTLMVIDHYRSKCDPNVQNEDANRNPLWMSVRKVVTLLKIINEKMQKLNDMCAELGSCPNSRVSWTKSVTLVNLAPRLLCSLCDRLWELKLSSLKYLLLISVTQLPIWNLRILLSVALEIIGASTTVFVELKNFQTYKIKLVKRALKELQFTFKSILLGPFFIFLQHVSTRLTRHPANGLQPAHPTVAWSEPLSMNSIRKVAESTGCSTFQVLASVLSGTVATYVKNNDSVSPKVQISIPVYSQNRSCSNEEIAVQSAEGYLNLTIPTSEAIGEYERLKLTVSMMTNSTQEFQLFLSIMFNRYLRPLFPHFVHSYFARRSASRHSPTLLNVVHLAFNDQHWNFCGSAIDRLYFWNTKLDPTLTLTTHRDKVTLIVTGNSSNLPRPNIIADQFIREFQALEWAVNSGEKAH